MLSISWSTLHYKPVGPSQRDETLMRLLDAQYTAAPFYGVRRMTEYLVKDKGFSVGRDHVRTLLRRMGLMAIWARPNTSKPHPEHPVYPYLLRGLDITRANQVWSADITYIRLAQGFAYLAAVIDWHSRYVLSWRLSNTLESGFCVEALNEALERYGNPEIFNSDQGAQFTSAEFIGALTKRSITISMDGRGRALDNIFVERLWRSVKYEDVYLKGYQTIPEVKEGLGRYFGFYNNARHHQGLGYRKPAEVYFGEAKRTEKRSEACRMDFITLARA